MQAALREYLNHVVGCPQCQETVGHCDEGKALDAAADVAMKAWRMQRRTENRRPISDTPGI